MNLRLSTLSLHVVAVSLAIAMTASEWLASAADDPAAEVREEPLDAAGQVDAIAPPTPWRGPQPAEGRPWPSDAHFFHRYWFQMGDEFANPPVNSRFRVNDPYVATHPNFHHRQEPSGNGMMLIPMKQSLRDIQAARLYLELWGGHPHTNHRRVTVNGRTTYLIKVASDEQCTHAYRNIPLKITDLVRGPNAVQFAVDGDHTFWGHFIVEEAAIDALLSPTSDELSQWNACVPVAPSVVVDVSEPETFLLELDVDAMAASQIARVHYFGRYDGFDENGDGQDQDWHGMTKRKEPIGHLGTADKHPYSVRWDTSMIKAQQGVQVRAVVELVGTEQMRAAEKRLKETGSRYWKAEGLSLQTAPSKELTITHPEGIEVTYVPSTNASVPFWSRANRKRQCEFAVPVKPGQIERAELHVAVWDGGAGTITDYFRFNGNALAVAAGAAHDVIYSKLPLDPSWILPEGNRAELLSDTDHHGIEVLYPGPMMAIRYRLE